VQIFSGGPGPFHTICIKPGFFRGGFFREGVSTKALVFIVSQPLWTVIVMKIVLTVSSLYILQRSPLLLRCQPTTKTDTAMKYYTGDWHYNDKFYTYNNVFECVGFDSPWNGWVTPVVDREQLEHLVSVEPDLSFDSAGNLVYRSPEYALDATFVIMPTNDGLYHLVDLGWCFEELSEEEYNDSI
jgi:hypothetical protein